MAEYCFSEDVLVSLCDSAEEGMENELKDTLDEISPEERGRFGPSTFNPRKQESPLTFACSFGHLPVLEYLLETFGHVIDLDALYYFDSKTTTLLIMACDSVAWYNEEIEYNDEVPRYLIAKGADVNVQDSAGNTALHFAYDLKTAKCLVESGANIDKVNNEGQTPVMFLILKDPPELEIVHMVETITYLLDKGADVSIRDRMGNTALHFAFYLETAKCLVENGADIDEVNNQGKTPVMSLASQHLWQSSIETMKYLLDKGAKTQHNGYSILHAADSGEIFKFLFNYGLSFQMFPSTSSCDGSTAIDSYPCPLYVHSCNHRKHKIVLSVLEKYASDCHDQVKINCRNLLSASPALYDPAISYEDHYCIRWLYVAKQFSSIEHSNLEKSKYHSEIVDQYLITYEKCFGRPSSEVVLLVFESYLDRGLVNEAMTMIDKAMHLELSYCQRFLSEPPSSTCALHFIAKLIGRLCNDSSTTRILKSHRDVLDQFNILLLIELNFVYLDLRSHYSMRCSEEDLVSLLKVFALSFNVPSLRPSIIPLANKLVSEFLHFSKGTNLLSVGLEVFMDECPALLEMLLQINGTRSVINDIDTEESYEQTLLLKVVSRISYFIENDEDCYYDKHRSVFKIMIDSGAHLDTTNCEGLTIFSDEYQSVLSDKLGLKVAIGVRSLYCLAANAIVVNQIQYEDLLPPHVVKFIRLHDIKYFKLLKDSFDD